MWVRVCVSAFPRDCSPLRFPDCVFFAHVSELPLTGQVAHTARISFSDLFS